MNIKTWLFKLGLRKIKAGDIVTGERDGFECVYLAIGSQLMVGRAKLGKQKSLSFREVVIVASSNPIDLNLSESDFEAFKISREYNWVDNFYIMDIEKITEVR